MSSKNRLGLNLFETNLKRHPSVKGLFDEDGKKKKSQINSKNELLVLNVDNKSEKESDDTSNNHDEENEKEKNIEKEIDSEEKDSKTENKKEKLTAIPVIINRVEEKEVDNSNSFFTELKDDEIKQIYKNREKFKTNIPKKLVVPLTYGFDNTQKEFDKSITNAMSKGQKYEHIENKFMHQLKKEK